MHSSARKALVALLLFTGATPDVAPAVESFLDGNPKVPEARYPRRGEATPVPTPVTPSPPR